MLKEFNVTLDISKHNHNPVYTFSTSDWQSLKFLVTVQNDGASVDLTGITPRIAIKKTDKTTILQDGTVTDATNGKCEFLLTSQAYVVGGAYKAEVMLYEGTEQVATTSGFTYMVSIGVMNIELESKDDWPTLSKAIEAGENETTRITAEETRTANENDRITSEDIRKTNEESRQIALTNMGTATESANTQAIYAQTQGDYAKAEADRLVGTDVSTLDNKIGPLTNLTTTNKTSVVNAINEQSSLLAQRATDITNLQTVKADKTEINTLVSGKADKTYVDTQVQAVASGSPKGVYATLSALQTAFPTGNSNVYLVTGNVKEVASLTVSAVPTVAGNITVTLNGVATNIAVDPVIETTTTLVATKIRNTVFPNGAVTGGTGSTVTFTASTGGVKTDATYSAGSTGATGTMTTTTQGVNADGNWYYWNGSAWTAGGIYQGTSDPETTDIRTGADGITYSSAGNAVRGQFNDIRQTIEVVYAKEIKMTNGYAIVSNVGIGNTVNLTPEVLSGTKYAIVGCKEGDSFKISGTGGNNSRLWAFIDANNKLLSVSNSTVTATDLILVAPKNATNLIINDNNSKKSYTGSELIDARIGANGTVYNNLGTAIREQFNGIGVKVEKVETTLYGKEIIMTNDYCIPLGSIGIGNVVNLTPVFLNTMRYAVVNCSEGDLIRVSGTGGDNPRLWGFIDANNKLLSVAAILKTEENKILTAPTGATKFITNDLKTGKISYVGIGEIETIDNDINDIDMSLMKTNSSLEEVNDNSYELMVNKKVLLSVKDLSVGAGTPTIKNYTNGTINIPYWEMIGSSNVNQSISSYIEPFDGVFYGVKISATIINPSGTPLETYSDVLQITVNGINYGEAISESSILLTPIVHKSSNPGVVDKIILSRLVKLDTSKPFIVSLHRNDESNEDTNPNPIGVVSIEVTPMKPITIKIPDKYNAWPFISNVGNKLICVYTKTLSHEELTSHDVYRKTSTNGGNTWSLEKMIVGTPDLREGVTGKGKDSQGRMLIWVRSGPLGSQSMSHSVYRTGDGDIWTKISSPVFNVLPGHIGDIIEVPTVGLVAFYNTYATSKSWGILISLDDGLTWTQREIEVGLTDSECPMEISGAYIKDGKILVMGRKEATSPDGNYSMFQMQSNDFGTAWTKQRTNITDIALSTPSLIYDSSKDLLSLYYFQRGAGILRLRRSTVLDIWDKPLNWKVSEEIAYGTTNAQDTGNVNAVVYGDKHIATYYSGDATNTGIYATIVEK